MKNPQKIVPSRDVDVRIAELLGFTDIGPDPTTEIYGLAPAAWRGGEEEPRMVIPRFTTSPSWALDILAWKLDNRVFSVLHVDPPEDDPDRKYRVILPSGKMLDWCCLLEGNREIRAPTLPLLVSRVFLATHDPT